MMHRRVVGVRNIHRPPVDRTVLVKVDRVVQHVHVDLVSQTQLPVILVRGLRVNHHPLVRACRTNPINQLLVEEEPRHQNDDVRPRLIDPRLQQIERHLDSALKVEHLAHLAVTFHTRRRHHRQHVIQIELMNIDASGTQP